MYFCCGIAWIFLFKMSHQAHHTSLSVKYSGRRLNFPPAQSSFEISLSKASSDQARGVHISQSPPMKFRVLATEVWCPGIATRFLCILHDRNFVASYSIREFTKKK